MSVRADHAGWMRIVYDREMSGGSTKGKQVIIVEALVVWLSTFDVDVG